MPLSHLRRPLFVLTALYVVALAALHGRGWFRVRVPADLEGFRFRLRVMVEGTVVSPLTENRLGPRVFVDADRAGGLPFEQKALVYLPKTDPGRFALRPGQRVMIEGRLRLPRPGRNPGDFDERGFLSDRGVGWVMKARWVSVVSEGVPWRWRARAWAETVRRSMEGSFERRLGPEEARVMSGLTLGFKGPLGRETNRAVQDAGVMHLLVPSGAKVAFVLLAAERLAGLVLGPPGRFLAAGAAGGFYTLMVGADPPYARAFLGWLALRAATLLGRSPGMFQAMTLSALVILILRPRDLFSAGFQMTYLAVGGLVLAMPRVSKALPRRWPGWVRAVAQALAVSVIVQAMLWPTFCAYFGRGAVVGVLANSLLVPASGLLMAAGFGLWGLSWAGEGPGRAAGAVVGALARTFVEVCRWFAGLPCAAVDLAPMSRGRMAAYYLLVLAALVAPRWKASAGLALAGLLAWTAAGLASRATSEMTVTFLCLPHGRAALVGFPEGGRWLVDAGGPAGTLLRAFKARGVAALDRVVLTGFDEGRWRGLARVLRERPVGSVTVPAGGVPPRLAAVLAEASRRGVAVLRDADAASLSLCRGKVCFDFSGVLPRVRRGEAEYSIIGPRLRWGSVEVTTDGEKARIEGPF